MKIKIIDNATMGGNHLNYGRDGYSLVRCPERPVRIPEPLESEMP